MEYLGALEGLAPGDRVLGLVIKDAGVRGTLGTKVLGVDDGYMGHNLLDREDTTALFKRAGSVRG